MVQKTRKNSIFNVIPNEFQDIFHS